MGLSSKLFICIFVANVFALSCAKSKKVEEGHVPFGTGRLTIEEYALLENAVKYIVGPHATVSDELLAFAERQSGVPTDLGEFLVYLPYFLQEARESGIRPSNGVDKKESNKNQAKLDIIVYDRASEWLANRGFPINGLSIGDGNGFQIKEDKKKNNGM